MSEAEERDKESEVDSELGDEDLYKIWDTQAPGPSETGLHGRHRAGLHDSYLTFQIFLKNQEILKSVDFAVSLTSVF